MIAEGIWERLNKSFVFKVWYQKRVDRCAKNLYDLRTKKLINTKTFNQIVVPDVALFIDFILGLDATMHISASSVEKQPIVVCKIRYLDIEVKRIARNVMEAVAVATCEFALEYDIKQLLKEGAD